MSLKGSVHVEHELSDVQKLRTEFQQMVQLRQASSMDAMRNMLAEFVRDDGQSESGCVEGSAAVGQRPAPAGLTAVEDSPGWAVPIALPETPAEAWLVRDTATAGRETILQFTRRKFAQFRRN